MALAHMFGLPRIGRVRELEQAVRRIAWLRREVTTVWLSSSNCHGFVAARSCWVGQTPFFAEP